MNNEKIYGYCPGCGEYHYRIVGAWYHEPERQDTDENPIWLWADADTMEIAGIDIDAAYENKIHCCKECGETLC